MRVVKVDKMIYNCSTTSRSYVHECQRGGYSGRDRIVSSLDGQLIQGEEILFSTKKHWIIFFWPAVFLVFALFSVGKSGFGVWLALAILFGLSSAISYIGSVYAVTNKRVFARSGVLRRRSLEVMIGKIEGVTVDEPLLGRILGYQTLVVRGTGGTPQQFHRVAKANELRRQVATVASNPAETRIVGTVFTAPAPQSDASAATPSPELRQS